MKPMLYLQSIENTAREEHALHLKLISEYIAADFRTRCFWKLLEQNSSVCTANPELCRTAEPWPSVGHPTHLPFTRTLDFLTCTVLSSIRVSGTKSPLDADIIRTSKTMPLKKSHDAGDVRKHALEL